MSFDRELNLGEFFQLGVAPFVFHCVFHEICLFQMSFLHFFLKIFKNADPIAPT